MTLPATITTGPVWPDAKNAPVGPFESGGSLYVILVDKSANKLRCYRSTDAGHTWAEVDSANAPASSTTTNYKSAYVVQGGSTLYAIQPLSSTSMNIRPFDCAANTWSAAITGPATITISTIFVDQVPFFGTRRSDGSFVIAYNGATESVMGTPYRRVKMHIRSAAGTWTGPFDVVGSANSPLANTNPGTQQHHVLESGVLGGADRVLLFLDIQSTMYVRVLQSANTFAAAAVSFVPSYTTDAPYASYGHAVRYTDGALTNVAVPFAHGASSPPGVKGVTVARCDSATAEVAANWSVSDPLVGSTEAEDSISAALAADGKKLWLWQCPSSDRGLRYTNDAGANTWGEVTRWKFGADILLSGFCVGPVTDGVGVVYIDMLGTPDVEQYVEDDEHRIGYSDTNGENRAFQKIRFTSATTLRYVRLLMRKVGSPSTAPEVAIFADNAGVPDQLTQIGFGGAVAANDVTAYYQWFSFLMTSVSLSANTDYWIRVLSNGSGNNTAHHYVTRVASTDEYAGGNLGTGTVAGGFTDVPGKDLTMLLYTGTDVEQVQYDRLDIYAPKGTLAVGSTETIVDLGEAPPALYEVMVDLGDNADPAGTVTISVDGGWDGTQFSPLSTDGPNAVQAINSLTINSPPRFLRVTSVVETSDSVLGVAGV